MQFMVISLSKVSSFVYGPFPNIRAAEAWAEVNVDKGTWQVAEFVRVDKNGRFH